MSTHYWKQEIRHFEETVIGAIEPSLEYVPNGITESYDAEFVEGYATTPSLPVVGRAYIEAGTPAELKTCQRWIDDAGSRAGRRRGRWQLTRGAHDHLADEDGVYVMLVTEAGEILDGRILPAEAVGQVASWTNGGRRYSTQRAYIPWSKVISPGTLDGGDVAAD